ncbi:MAG: hypothetical protein LC808_01070 [Actinobacteria bacterium]|nr:hypothetical protein [Actinomycetota bacterium]
MSKASAVRRTLPSLTPVFETFWRFAFERQEIFQRRVSGQSAPWSDDDILCTYKFTNAYRASDRASQYLIRQVIYQGEQTPAELFFRIVLFKLFNRIETWETLVANYGSPHLSSYSFEAYDDVLSQMLQRGEPIYSAAYIMPPIAIFGHERKHQNHLRLLEAMLEDRVPETVTEAPDMRCVFEILRSYPGIGPFLAYQLATDLNYSVLTNFSERDFVVPGPGARRGLRKCFADLGDLGEEDTIRWLADSQEEEFNKRGLGFRSLWGRALQLIDVQNLLCEVDKYARVAHPHLSVERKRIKQRFSPCSEPLQSPWYPPKWGLNPLIAASGS